MAHSTPALVEALATRMLAELDRYDTLLDELLQRAWDPALLLALGEQAERVYHCGQALPGMAVTFTEFLITRAEFSHGLWTGTRSGTHRRVALLHREHAAAVETLRRACKRMRVNLVTGTIGTGEGAVKVVRALERVRAEER